jgi:hypothetical protein
MKRKIKASINDRLLLLLSPFLLLLQMESFMLPSHAVLVAIRFVWISFALSCPQDLPLLVLTLSSSPSVDERLSANPFCFVWIRW